jgi:hypothetical protein
MVELHIEVRPPDAAEGDASKKTSGVNTVWLRQHFTVCPQGAAEAVVERHTRVWLWHFVAMFLLPDAAGNTVSWMVLPLLGQVWDNIRGYSWGSAVLAWLYRQLCDACSRSGQDANLGGCAYLLQIWIWERLPVGRPHRGPVEVHTNLLFFIHADLYSSIIHLSNFGTILQALHKRVGLSYLGTGKNPCPLVRVQFVNYGSSHIL